MILRSIIDLVRLAQFGLLRWIQNPIFTGSNPVSDTMLVRMITVFLLFKTSAIGLFNQQFIIV